MAIPVLCWFDGLKRQANRLTTQRSVGLKKLLTEDRDKKRADAKAILEQSCAASEEELARTWQEEDA